MQVHQNGTDEQAGGWVYPSAFHPQAAMVPLIEAFVYIHQKFLVLTSAFQCDLQQH